MYFALFCYKLGKDDEIKSLIMTKTTIKSTKEEAIEAVSKCDIKHIAFIMDGNRRWAKQNNLPKTIGHTTGRKVFREIVNHAVTLGLKYVTTYAFSTENWNREAEEVSFLMDLLLESLKKDIKEFHQNNIKVKFIGRRDRVSAKTAKLMAEAEQTTGQNTAITLQIAIDYGSRSEITQAVKKIATLIEENKLTPEEITEETLENFLYTAEVPDPDLIIRTGGEYRLSNYLLWQAAYSELFISEKYWPEFTSEDMETAILDFAKRHRRWGG